MGWERLAELARREHLAVEAASWDELAELQLDRERVIGSVTGPLPPEAAPVLRAALAQSRETEQALRGDLARTAGLLAALRRGRRVISAYGVASDSGVETRA